MKILFFIDGFKKGGKERRLIEFLKIIETNNEIDYRVVTIHQELEFNFLIEIRDKIIFISKCSKKDIRPFFEFYKVCKAYDPDIVHTWSAMVTFYSLPAVMILKKKLVNSQITNAPPKIKSISFFRLICSVNFYFSDFILSNSKAGLKSYKVLTNKSRVIYNGLDMLRFEIDNTKEEIKSQLCISTNYCVVMVASFSDNKDYMTFINLASKIQKFRDDVTFIVVGDGKNLEKSIDHVSELNLENFKFLYKRNDVEKILKACDIGFLISNLNIHGEGNSNSIMEYMASGLPVIANNSGGNHEIVIDNYNGYLIKESSSITFLKYTLKLLDDYELRMKLGNNGKKMIKERFTADRMTKDFINTYIELLS